MFKSKLAHESTAVEIGTPVRRDHQLEQGVTVGQHINVYNLGDGIQTIGDPLGSPAGRTFRGDVHNLRIQYVYSAHGNMIHYSHINRNLGGCGGDPARNHSFMHNNQDIWNNLIFPIFRR